MAIEVWREIDGYPAYKVSNFGRVKNLTGRVLKPHDDGRGYWQIGLSRSGIKQNFKVHRLVCIAFHGQPQPGQEVAHLDGNRSNPNADNLVWASRSENVLHAIGHGTHVGFDKSGERHPRAKLNSRDVADIREMLRKGVKQAVIARRYGVSRSAVNNIATGKRWIEPLRVSPVPASIAFAGDN